MNSQVIIVERNLHNFDNKNVDFTYFDHKSVYSWDKRLDEKEWDEVKELSKNYWNDFNSKNEEEDTGISANLLMFETYDDAQKYVDDNYADYKEKLYIHKKNADDRETLIKFIRLFETFE